MPPALDLPLLHMLIRQTHKWQVSLLAEFWKAPRPSLVVSVIPHFNRAILEGLRTADLAMEGMRRQWRRYDRLSRLPAAFLDRTSMPASDLRNPRGGRSGAGRGHRTRIVWLTSGMIVRPEFYRPMGIDRGAERIRLGLLPDRPTGLVMFGGYGSRAMLTIARRAAMASSEAPDDFPLRPQSEAAGVASLQWNCPTQHISKALPATWLVTCASLIFSSANPAREVSVRHW